MSRFETVRRQWAIVARRIGDAQARLLLSVFYVVVLGPIALGSRLTSDPLGLCPSTASGWRPRPEPAGGHLGSARRQF